MLKPYIDLYTRLALIAAGLIITLTYLFKFEFPFQNIFAQILIIIIIFSTTYNIINRDFYLPFLGQTVFPLTPTNISGNLINVKLDNLPPQTNVVYWASQENESQFEDPVSAYGNYKNSGIGKTNEIGELDIKILKPSAYKVPKFGSKKTLQPHVHYRFEKPEYPGMFSRIYTKNLTY